ncbi:MAG: response regulator [Acidobacteriota bacterium]
MSDALPKHRLLIVDDSPESIRILAEEFRETCEVLVATGGETALDRASADVLPDLILLDILMPGMDGYETCRRLKANPRTQHIPIVFITAQDAEEDELRGLESGAVDYISKPFSLPLVRARVRTHLDLKRKSDILAMLSARDGLTGIPNRRQFDESLNVEWQRAVRGQYWLALAMVDIDHFKAFNDRYGHLAGDCCLRRVAQVLGSSVLRASDLVARYGGEEFAAVLPQVDTAGASAVAETMLSRVRELGIRHERSSVADVVTISIGVSCVVPELHSSPSILIDAADRQLYLAKEHGRNRFFAGSVGADSSVSSEAPAGSPGDVVTSVGGTDHARMMRRPRSTGRAPQGRAPCEDTDTDRVLVVDDDDINIGLLSSWLESHGYVVSSALEGQIAIAMAETSRFDAVILDVVMPGLNGIGVLRELRRMHSATELPIIMATACNASTDIVEALSLGANDYVTKPLDLPVVLARLRAQLALKRANECVQRLMGELDLRNRFIRTTFGRYLSQDVVSSLLDTPEGLRLGGEMRVVTILMADLRGFTLLTHELNPEVVMTGLNNYLGTMSDIIIRHRGTIDEFIGDAILALFGTPMTAEDDARRAVHCALEMQRAMESVTNRNAAAGLPRIEMGIALNTGPVVAGNNGSEMRAKYGVVGTHVNLAGRIESFTVGGQILMTESTRLAAGPDVVIGRTFALNAKGFRDPVVAHELVGIGGPDRISLEPVQDVFRRLHAEVPVECWVLSGKLIDTESFSGSIVGVSPRGALLRSDSRPASLVDLRVRIAADALPGAEVDAYAKVVDSRHGEIQLRFTAVRPELRRYLDAELDPTQAGVEPAERISHDVTSRCRES